MSKEIFTDGSIITVADPANTGQKSPLQMLFERSMPVPADYKWDGITYDDPILQGSWLAWQCAWIQRKYLDAAICREPVIAKYAGFVTKRARTNTECAEEILRRMA